MPREQKETNFAGKIYSQKARDGSKQVVIDQAILLEVLNDSGVQAATDVDGLLTALIAAVTALE